MDGSVRTEQVLLEEVRVLRARIAELERTEERFRQKDADYHHLLKLYQEQQQVLIEARAHQRNLQHALDEVLAFGRQAQPFDTVFETVTVGLAVYNQHGNVIRMNAAFRDLMGLHGQGLYLAQSLEQRGKHLKIHDGNGYSLPPEMWPINRILHGEVLTSQNSTDVGMTTLDGYEILVSVSGAPLYNEQGQVTGAVVVYQDVTERRKLTQRTQEALRALLAMAEILVQGTDFTETGETPVKSTVKSTVNRILQRLMKLARRILGCKRISVTLIDTDQERLQPIAIVGLNGEETLRWQKTFEGRMLSEYLRDTHRLTTLYAGGPVRIDNTKHPDPTYHYYSMLMPMHVGSRLVGFITIDYDDRSYTWAREELTLAEMVSRLTVLVLEHERLLLERAEAHANELALLEANRRMDEFLSIASHELRTPLTTINGNIQLAKRRVKALAVPDSVSDEFVGKLDFILELLGRAERQVRIQNRLVSDLLDVSRIQANRLELYTVPCDLLDIVREAIEDQRSAVPLRTLRLDVVGEYTTLPILADGDRISQVITNYLTNALKYSPSDRPVTVSIALEDTQVRVAVNDEGPGIPLEEQERLWQRFYRVPGINVQSGSGVGLGLGLHICRTIVERHQGYVGVRSAPGQGSTFWFTLPVLPDEHSSNQVTPSFQE